MTRILTALTSWWRGLFFPPRRPRVVLDTNILIASVLDPASAAHAVWAAWDAGSLDVIVSPAIAREYELVLAKHGLVRRRPEMRATAARLLADLRERAVPVANTKLPRPKSTHAADDKFLAAAVAGEADAVVSHDRHLTRVRRYKGIPVVSAERFLARWREGAWGRR